MKITAPKNYHLFVRLSLVFFVIQFVTRIILNFEHAAGPLQFIDLILSGVIWDIHAWLFLGLPVLLISTFARGKLDGLKTSAVIIFLFSCVWTFVAVCEFNFWNEFHSRFNFIAVDYLIYTNEVLANIRESFRLDLIIAGVVAISLLLTFFVEKIKIVDPAKTYVKKSAGVVGLGLIAPLLFLFVIGPVIENHNKAFRIDQLSRNGWVEFYRAFRSNHIDYNNFYVTIPEKAAEEIVKSKNVPAGDFQNPFHKKPNVVMIVVESLGAKFISTLNGQKDTTPFLNQLSDDSVFFTNLYSTGTRTVRGLEAINLSIPPTPGYAVVKRPDHKNLFSLGNTFKANNYDPVFLYGGRGFFDNMNSFFSGNAFSVIDQHDFQKNEIEFTNAWGVCDEDLFAKAGKIMDQRQKDKPTLLFMLTTSNHRPFTYPAGKIDIPSGASRAGAVKYTDYAIGKFITESKKKEWFKDTLFVIVADHSTEGRGQFDLEMADFHIPMWIYAPGKLKPQKIDKLVSQIDILPSVIDLLDLKDDSPFFGKSFFNKNWNEERAFIGNYQYVGYYQNQVVTTLGPNQAVRSFSYDPKSEVQKDIKSSPYVNEAAAFYQYASTLLDKGRYHVDQQ